MRKKIAIATLLVLLFSACTPVPADPVQMRADGEWATRAPAASHSVK